MMAMAWVKKRFFFSKASFSVSGLEFGRSIAEYSFLGFLVVFIKKNLDENMRYSAVVSTSKDSVAAIVASFAVYWCYHRPFSMIVHTHVMFVTGIVMLLVEILYGDAVFYPAIILLSLEKLGQKYMDEFLGSQQDKESNAGKYDACFYIANISALITSVGILSFLDLDSEIILIISVSVIAAGLAFFLIYSKLAHLELEPNQDEDGDEEQDGDQEKFPLLKLLLCWTPFLIYYMVEAAGSAFFIEQWKTDQGKTLWDIGESELYMMQKISGIIVSYMISKMINMFWRKNNSDQKQQERCVMLTKIAFGMFICTCCCMDAFYTEAQRLRSAKTRDDDDDDPGIDIPLNVMFILQFILFGTMGKLVGEKMKAYFLYHVPRPRHHLEYVFTSFMEGIGKLLVVICILVSKKLIGDSANESRLDILYLVLAVLSFCGLIAFVSLSYHSEKRKMIRAAPVSRQDSSSSPSEGITIEMMAQSKSDNADNLAVVSAGAGAGAGADDDELLQNSDDNLAVVVFAGVGADDDELLQNSDDNLAAVVSAGAGADDDELLQNSDDNLAAVVASAAGAGAAVVDVDDELLQNSDENLAVVVASAAGAADDDHDHDQLLITIISETESPQSSVEPSPVDHTESETVALLPSPHNPTRSRRWPILKNFLKSISALRYRHQA